ncbi:Trehalose utilization [Caulifigura coniformis]|uniref:Trehalose utilization n=1 Tax=Caulifigura coniformis TaxID=2527983 RepID=A0A517S902_9PLAN|nr:ThuA domain-containing protein [Caulifigura coniformis]QDT52611.1 Trehalose utilization [Caulifigura coniformis]
MQSGFRCLTAIALCLIAALPVIGQEKPQPSRMLFVTQSAGFKHGSVNRKDATLAPAEVSMKTLGEQTSLFTVDCTQDCAADFTKENLKKYDIVAFYTTLDLPIADDAKNYFFGEWIYEKGHGVLGFHSAGDTFHNYAPYWDLMGGVFIGHPWNAGTKVTLTNHEPNHPLVASFGPEFSLKEEIYMYRRWQPEKCRVLLSLDYAKSPLNGGKINTQYGAHVPVCWIKTMGEGKLYYNNLGHNESSWANKQYLDSITAAVKWMRGEIECDAKPNPAVSTEFEEKSQKDIKEHGFQTVQQVKND